MPRTCATCAPSGTGWATTWSVSTIWIWRRPHSERHRRSRLRTGRREGPAAGDRRLALAREDLRHPGRQRRAGGEGRGGPAHSRGPLRGCDGAARGGPAAGPHARRRGRARRGDPWRHPAFRVRVRRGDRRADPGLAGRVHPGGQRRAHHEHRGAGARSRRAARFGGGQGRAGLRGRAGRRADPARAARRELTTVAEWELEARPRRSVRNAWIVAVLVLAVFTVGGVFLRNGSTGVNFRVVDQIAMVAIGVLVAGGVLLLTRPRVRAGERGIEVRGVLGETLFGWDQVRGVSFPDRKAWARLELADDDYVPLLAIRAN